MVLLFVEALDSYERALELYTNRITDNVIRHEAAEDRSLKTVIDRNGQIGLQFGPDFMEAVKDALCAEPAYAIYSYNIGSVLTAMGRIAEARSRIKEAIEFTPKGMRYDDPVQALQSLNDL